MSKKKSFIIHKDSLSVLDELTDEQVGKLFRAIKAFHLEENFELDHITKIVFNPFKNQFIRDDEKYLETCKKRAEAGSKGGKQKAANASNSYQDLANLADSDSKSDSESKSKKDSKSKFIKPSQKEVKDYMTNYSTEKKLQVGDLNAESEKFVDFYTAKDWYVGKNKMKDWKAAVRNWFRNNQPKQEQEPIKQITDFRR